MTAMVYLGATGKKKKSNIKFLYTHIHTKKMTPLLELVGADLRPVA